MSKVRKNNTPPKKFFEINPITAKFVHESYDVYQLFFNHDSTALGVTGNHPIWSLDRQAWIGAGDLHIGERVRGGDSSLVLTARTHLAGKHTVYNLEVYREHTFRVRDEGVWVHNSCISWGGIIGDYGRKAIDHIWEGHSYMNRNHGVKSYFSGLYNTKGKIKQLVNNSLKKITDADYTLLEGGKSKYVTLELDDFVGTDRSGRATKLDPATNQIKNAFPGALK